MQLVQLGGYSEVKAAMIKEDGELLDPYFNELESSYSVEHDLQGKLHYMPAESALTVENDVPHLEHVGQLEVGYTIGQCPMKLHTETLDVYRYNGALFAKDVVSG